MGGAGQNRRVLLAAALVTAMAVPLMWLHSGVSPEVSQVPEISAKELNRLRLAAEEAERLRAELAETQRRLAAAAEAQKGRQFSAPRLDARPLGAAGGGARWTQGVRATLYSEPDCRGNSKTFNLSSRESLCQGCLDTCNHKWDDAGGSMHGPRGGLVQSLRVSGIGWMQGVENCAGTFAYGDIESDLARSPKWTEKEGCIQLTRLVGSFRLAVDWSHVPGGSLAGLRQAVQSLDPPEPSTEILKEASLTGPNAPASRFQARDWLPEIKKADLHRNYSARFKTPEFLSGERLASCGNAEADKHNAYGVALVRAHITDATVPRKVDTLMEAEHPFRKAIELAPDCATPNLNLAIVMLVRLGADRLDEGRQYARAAVKADPNNPKALMWAAIYAELQGCDDEEKRRPTGNMAESAGLYRRAFSIDNTLPMRYFGRPHESWGTRTVPGEPRLFYDPNDVTMENFGAHELQRQGMRKLLLYKEFSEYYGGHGAITKQEADGFVDIWAVALPKLIPPYPLRALKETYSAMVRGRYLRWQGADTPYWPENRYTHNNGPMARFSHAAILPRIESLTDRKLMPTYSYMGSYLAGGGIIPHLDREQCEYTLSVTLDTPDSPMGSSSVCPFGFALEPNVVGPTGNTDNPFPKNKLPPEDKQAIFNSYAGDGAIIRGRAVVHWRPPSIVNCTQFFLHFVLDSFTGDLN